MQVGVGRARLLASALRCLRAAAARGSCPSCCVPCLPCPVLRCLSLPPLPHHRAAPDAAAGEPDDQRLGRVLRLAHGAQAADQGTPNVRMKQSPGAPQAQPAGAIAPAAYCGRHTHQRAAVTAGQCAAGRLACTLPAGPLCPALLNDGTAPAQAHMCNPHRRLPVLPPRPVPLPTESGGRALLGTCGRYCKARLCWCPLAGAERWGGSVGPPPKSPSGSPCTRVLSNPVLPAAAIGLIHRASRHLVLCSCISIQPAPCTLQAWAPRHAASAAAAGRPPWRHSCWLQRSPRGLLKQPVRACMPACARKGQLGCRTRAHLPPEPSIPAATRPLVRRERCQQCSRHLQRGWRQRVHRRRRRRCAAASRRARPAPAALSTVDCKQPALAPGLPPHPPPPLRSSPVLQPRWRR